MVVLGKAGRNFAAGMSGGVAYVLDNEGTFPIHCNRQMVEIGRVDEPDDIDELKAMIEKHANYTGSTVAQKVLDHWSETLPKFVKVLPKDYKRVLEAEKRVRAQGLSGEEATMAAFLENIKDLSRVSGN